MKKQNKIYLGIIIFLAITIIFLLIQNSNLNKEVTKVNQDFEKALDNFNLFLIEKVEKCESVMLMVGNQSAIVNNIHCE